MQHQIINGDTTAEIKNIPDESVDLVVTDPPYMMNYQSGHRSKETRFKKIQNDVNSYDLISGYFAECHRIMKENTAIYAFCSWHKVDFFKSEFEKHFTLKNIIVWNKDNHGSGDLKGAYAPKHEFVLFGHKGRAEFKRERIPDVINCPKVPGNRMTHPTEKPVDLLDIFIKNSSDIGDVVFDGFLGTGSTGVSAAKNGRSIIGIEIEPEYAKIAEKRINSTGNQLELFL